MRRSGTREPDRKVGRDRNTADHERYQVAHFSCDDRRAPAGYEEQEYRRHRLTLWSSRRSSRRNTSHRRQHISEGRLEYDSYERDGVVYVRGDHVNEVAAHVQGCTGFGSHARSEASARSAWSAWRHTSGLRIYPPSRRGGASCGMVGPKRD